DGTEINPAVEIDRVAEVAVGSRILAALRKDVYYALNRRLGDAIVLPHVVPVDQVDAAVLGRLDQLMRVRTRLIRQQLRIAGGNVQICSVIMCLSERGPIVQDLAARIDLDDAVTIIDAP